MMMDMKGPMMEMYFHFRIKEPILFKEWMPENMTAYVFTCIAVGAIAFVYELVKFGRTKVDSDESSHDCCDTELHISDSEEDHLTRLPFSPSLLTRGQHIASCIIYFVQTFGAYCLMMISMTYNVPIVLSMLLGHILAFFLLGPLQRSMDETGDCCG